MSVARLQPVFIFSGLGLFSEPPRDDNGSAGIIMGPRYHRYARRYKNMSVARLQPVFIFSGLGLFSEPPRDDNGSAGTIMGPRYYRYARRDTKKKFSVARLQPGPVFSGLGLLLESPGDDNGGAGVIMGPRYHRYVRRYKKNVSCDVATSSYFFWVGFSELWPQNASGLLANYPPVGSLTDYKFLGAS